MAGRMEVHPELRGQVDRAFDLLAIPSERTHNRRQWVDIIALMAAGRIGCSDRRPRGFARASITTTENEIQNIVKYAGKLCEKHGTKRISSKDREKLALILENIHSPAVAALAATGVSWADPVPTLLDVGALRTRLPTDLRASDWESRISPDDLRFIESKALEAVNRISPPQPADVGALTSPLPNREGAPENPFAKAIGNVSARAYWDVTGLDPIVSTVTETNSARLGLAVGAAYGPYVKFAEMIREAVGLNPRSSHTLAAASRMRGGKGRKK